MAPDDGEPPPSLGRRLRYFARVHRLVFSILVFAIGILLTVLGTGDLTPLNQSTPFVQIDQYTAPTVNGNVTVNYNLAFIIAGPIVLLIGAYFVGSYYLARRKFEHLMETKSKAEFLRNLPEIEDLLWDLTPADEARYSTKKADLRVRR